MKKEGTVKTIFSIGHSNHSIEKFIAMLHSFSITVLADIRSMPGSNKYPHFNQAALETSVREAGIRYIHMPVLGGRRKPQPGSVNTALRNKSFQAYADYMQTDEFKAGIAELEKIAIEEKVAYMCSEAVWWRCHRAMVSDYMRMQGWRVIHIMNEAKSMEHPDRSIARPAQGNLFYDEN